jgi:Cu-processing system ATP-binding protein
VDVRATRVERVLRTVGIADAADRRVGGYSNGMNRRLGLATKLVGNPSVLLLDEPTAGLDPAGVADFHEIAETLSRETDVTIVVTSHVLSEIERLCDRVAILDEGRVTVEGDVTDLRRAAGDSVSVVATVDDPERAARSMATSAGVVDVTAGPTRVRVAVERAAVFDVLEDLRNAAEVAAVEVTEPGLEAVFRDSVAAERGVTVGTAGGERR